MSYIELHCHSAFSLLDGASLPEHLVARAHAIGLPALALTDHDELGGTVRFAQAAGDIGLPALIGAELTVATTAGDDAPLSHLVLLAESREGYGNLSTLVTHARMHSGRGRPRVTLDELARHANGLFALTGCPRGWVPSLVASGDPDAACEAAATLLDIFDRRVAIECWDHHLPEERTTVRELLRIARALAMPWVVTNDVHYAEPPGRIVHDVLAALRHECTLDEMGTRLRPNGEWYLKSAAQMRRRWQQDDTGIRETLRIAERCAFRMEHLAPALPAFPLPPGVTADEYLERLVHQGATERWGGGTDVHRRQIAHELDIIRKLGLAGYFLIVWDIVRFARREGVLCQGRGSAANSAVCFCLGITSVDPIKLGLLFERFLSEERREAPDIDIDFAHRDREKVLQYVYERYGREHAAMVCEQISYRGRSAVRDAARVLGFSQQQADTLAALSDRFSARDTAERFREQAEAQSDDATHSVQPSATVLGQGMVGGTEATSRAREVREQSKKVAATTERPSKRIPRGAKRPMTAADRPNPNAAYEPYGSPNGQESGMAKRLTEPFDAPLESTVVDFRDRRVRALVEIVHGLHQLPRHRSIHVGGFVLTEEPLSRVVPIEPASMDDRTVIQWEKDDLEPIGLVKIDLLGLGMLTLIQDCLKYIRLTRGVSLDLGDLDMYDQAVYDDLCAADTIGIFQVESRAQMITLPRLKPRCFYDLVIQVAIIRPGPIQGDMVHPFLRRRAGEEEVNYPHPSLEPILKRTLGVPLFQEQGMQVAIACAGFTAGEADQLRRAMGHKRSRERMAAICQRLIDGMIANGIAHETAMRIYNQINAFADYGFPESHAASFALLVYASAYLKHYYAAEFTCAILNAQPMGFYAPGTLIEDARRHGVEVRPVDLTKSAWDHTLELDGVCTVVPHDGVMRVQNRRPRDGEDPRSPRRAPALRLGLRIVRGLGAKAREKLERALEDGPFHSPADVVRRTGLDQRSLRHIAESGAFDSMFAHEPPERRRRAALWAVLDAMRGDAGPLAPRRPDPTAIDRTPPLPSMSGYELTEADYRVTGLTLGPHPMTHLRETLRPNGILTAKEVVSRGRDGQRVATAGLVICRQRPGTAKGFVFLTLEDETGLVNIVVTPKRFERQALLISTTALLLVRGVLQVEGPVVHVRGDVFRALDARVGAEHARSHDFH